MSSCFVFAWFWIFGFEKSARLNWKSCRNYIYNVDKYLILSKNGIWSWYGTKCIAVVPDQLHNMEIWHHAKYPSACFRQQFYGLKIFFGGRRNEHLGVWNLETFATILFGTSISNVFLKIFRGITCTIQRTALTRWSLVTNTNVHTNISGRQTLTHVHSHNF